MLLNVCSSLTTSNETDKFSRNYGIMVYDNHLCINLKHLQWLKKNLYMYCTR